MGTSASFARKALSCLAAALLAFTLVPASALAGQEGSESVESAGAEGSEGAFGSEVPTSPQPPSNPSTEADDLASAASSAEAGTLAASLMGRPASFVNADVALDSEPIIGSFTVDGLTFAVTEGANIELVGALGSEVAGSTRAASDAEAESSASESDASFIALPGSVAYNSVDYAVTSIGAYAFYLSGVTSVELPAGISNVDDRAFRSSDVASIEVAEGNPTYSSFDGALYSADQSSLLLIPEGKQGAVLLPKGTEVAEAGKFSHCSLVDAISVEDGAAFASENGLLYTSDLTTLLRVPAGATEITIREGCTTIAAGAMEACVKLERINAPASVTSISPDVFTSVPTVSLPAAAVVVGASADPTQADEAHRSEGAEAQQVPSGATSPQTPSTSSAEASGTTTTQLTAMVALSSTDDDLPEVVSSFIEVALLKSSNVSAWERAGMTLIEVGSLSEDLSVPSAQASAGSASTYSSFSVYFYSNVPVTATVHPKKNPGNVYAGSIFYRSISWDSPYYAGTSENWIPRGNYVQVNLTPAANQRWDDVDPRAPGYYLDGFYTGAAMLPSQKTSLNTAYYSSSIYIKMLPITYVIKLDLNEGLGLGSDEISATYDQDVELPMPIRAGYRFLGWNTSADGSGASYQAGAVRNLTTTSGETVTLYAQWQSCTIDFDVDSEPEDEDYPGEEKPSITAPDEMDDEGKVEIADPKRPGYVFQGWTIPNAEGTEAIDQDLVYEGEDGKWYVDASKLPDYTDGSGRVELTARWTSVISVDVPSSVTFYADVVTQGNESREGAASSAFGQNKVASQSQVDLRIVGLESQQVRGNSSTTLGASDILGKKDGGAVSGTADKIFSLYPTDEALAPDDLQDPGAVSAAKPADAVDFALDDILLERSFAGTAEKFTIPSGGTLNLGYRLNLSEAGIELDYDKLSTLGEGQSASIANISYCFAADAWPAFWTYDDNGRMRNIYAIKADAEAIAAGDSTTIAKYTDWMNADHRFYVRWFDKGVSETDADSEDDSSVYEVRIIGLNHDDRSDGSGKAGITFQLVDCLNATYRQGTSIAGGWQRSELRAKLNPDELTAGVVVNGIDDNAIWNQVPELLQHNMVTVAKGSVAQQAWNSPVATTNDRMFLLCMKEYYPHTLSTSVPGFYLIPLELDSYNCTTGGFGSEGRTYDYYTTLDCPYNNSAGSSAGPASALAKKVNGVLAGMWTRSLSVSDATGSSRYNYIKSNGAVWDSVVTNAHGVSPAFCL